MSQIFTFTIYSETKNLPATWDEIAHSNIFLSSKYLRVLERSAPLNMTCFFIGIFEDDELVGCALSQFLNSDLLTSYGDRDKCLKSSIRTFAFKKFASHVLFVGNNMLTGQNAFVYKERSNKKAIFKVLHDSIIAIKAIIKSKGKTVHITTIKDFEKTEVIDLQSEFKSAYVFSTQPNMVFDIRDDWKSENDYIAALSKKYRDQYKRARKKAIGIEKRKLNLAEIIALEDNIYALYFHVAKNAPFNTFFLAKNHFSIFKEILQDDFLFYGYFLDEKLIGFNTLIKNGTAMDTYFLGYEEKLQREKMLYLNMLYDMISYSIKKGFKEIIFARTALEIKSSVGAKPVPMFGLITHKNNILQSKMPKFFGYFEPKTEWQERNPFQ
ncbi:peptidogalycan biosysnthesis protein [Flavobacterium sp. TAB 87]|uniref:peptidogalycan biosysnthesis protein n=1 Tax=Flavobacterium sp. TAB 87 TaxID=1729581 RepID=UPI00076BEA41|nr:peptidogalycan biosysnthesis protein [Flavobacterium sp. TAB 87]KVV14306.1 hypothetical protein AP058_02198 [Flavobacterium sp. TAB 87]